MSDVDAFTILRSCSTKSRYSTEDKARQVATDCWYKRRINLRVYACEACGGFHLTRQSADALMRPGWRLPKKSERAKAEQRKQRRRKR